MRRCDKWEGQISLEEGNILLQLRQPSAHRVKVVGAKRLEAVQMRSQLSGVPVSLPTAKQPIEDDERSDDRERSQHSAPVGRLRRRVLHRGYNGS